MFLQNVLAIMYVFSLTRISMLCCKVPQHYFVLFLVKITEHFLLFVSLRIAKYLPIDKNLFCGINVNRTDPSAPPSFHVSVIDYQWLLLQYRIKCPAAFSEYFSHGTSSLNFGEISTNVLSLIYLNTLELRTGEKHHPHYMKRDMLQMSR